MVEVMFVPASSRAQSGMSGWLEEERFPDVAKYIHRACYLLSQGRPAAKLAVLYPVSSFWLGDHAVDSCAGAIMQQLLDTQYDFDLIDEEAVESLMTLRDGEFINKSGQSYTTIILPPLTALSSGAIEQLKAFQRNGGKVISIGNDSILLGNENFRNGERISFHWDIEEPSGKLTPRVFSALGESDFQLDQSAPAIKYTHRRWNDAEIYFLFNEGDETLNQHVTLAGEGSLQVWDAMSGEVADLPEEVAGNGFIKTEITLEPWETRFLVIRKK